MRADKLQYGQVSSLLPLKVGFFQVQLNFLMLKMSVVDLKLSPTNSACFPPSRIWPGLGSFNEDKVVVVMPVLEPRLEKSGGACFSEPCVTL